MLNINQLIGFAAGGGVAGSVTYIGKASSASMTNPHTFTSQAIGAADPTRRVFVAVHTSEAGAGTSTPTSMTIGGISATQHVLQEDGGCSTSIWSALVPTGTTANIVIDFDQTGNDLHIAVYRAVNLVNSTFHDDAGDINDPASSVINIPANGILIVAYTNAGSAVTTLGNVTETYDDEMTDQGFRASGGFMSGLAAQTNRAISADGTNGDAAFVGLSWA